MAKEPTDAIVSLLMDELRRTLEPKISHILADYQLFKETHNAVLQIPFVQLLLKQQKMCKCHEPELEEPEPIRLEIIDKVPTDAPNLDSIANYINSTAEDEEAEEAVAQEEAEEEEEEEITDTDTDSETNEVEEPYKETEEETKIEFVKTTLMDSQRGQLFIAEHIFGKPKEIIEATHNVNDFNIKDIFKVGNSNKSEI